MSLDLDALPVIRARWAQDRPAGARLWVVMHAMQAPETLTTAESCGRYFATVDEPPRSTHFGVDADSIVRYLDDHKVPYAAGGANTNGLHIEHAGYSEQLTPEWLDDYGKKMLRLSAALTRALCARYAIPMQWVGPEELLMGVPGLTTHGDCSVAFGGTHWDPGPEFPKDFYLSLVKGTGMNLTIHEAWLRARGVLDFTWLPPDGTQVGGFRIASTVCVRIEQGDTGADARCAVWAGGQRGPDVILPGNGSTVLVPVPQPGGLVSLDASDNPGGARAITAEARELWT